ncbi:MAG: DNA-binding domain-containing protein [Gammaproteobacteria bacterium]|nr:DNA-binding domain-containing protein [Gammaproteobacteria bacterium]
MLSKLQQQFWGALTQYDNAIIASISSQGKLSADDRVEIYRTNVRSSHVSVLMSVYAVCEKILGSDYFKQIAINYYKRYPSSSYDLNDYGHKFPSYLKQLLMQRSELVDFQYLSDLAQLEWKIQKVYFSADNVLLDMAEFQKSCVNEAGDMKFSLQAGIDIQYSEFPIAELWEIHQTSTVAQQIEITNKSEHICIYRDGLQVVLKKIDEDLFSVISAIQDNKSLSEIADIFIDGNRLNTALEKLIKNQWLRH